MSGSKKLLILILVAVGLVLANFVSPLRVEHLIIQLKPEPVAQIGRFTITNTLISSWLAMLLLIILAVLGSRNLQDKPKAWSLQNILESAFEALYNFMQNFAGERTRSFFPIVGTLFLFILVMNWIGLLPGFGSIGLWEEQEGQRLFVPLLRGATTDLNTTVALAICAVLSLQVYGLRTLGARAYLGRFVAIGKFVAFGRALLKEGQVRVNLLFQGVLELFIGVLDIFEEITKIISFSFRLFGNMFGGEVLLAVMAFLAPYVVSIPFMALEIFGGFIQALIFAILSTAFLSRATSSHQAEETTGDETPASPQAVTS